MVRTEVVQNDVEVVLARGRIGLNDALDTLQEGLDPFRRRAVANTDLGVDAPVEVRMPMLSTMLDTALELGMDSTES